MLYVHFFLVFRFHFRFYSVLRFSLCSLVSEREWEGKKVKGRNMWNRLVKYLSCDYELNWWYASGGVEQEKINVFFVLFLGTQEGSGKPQTRRIILCITGATAAGREAALKNKKTLRKTRWWYWELQERKSVEIPKDRKKRKSTSTGTAAVWHWHNDRLLTVSLFSPLTSLQTTVAPLFTLLTCHQTNDDVLLGMLTQERVSAIDPTRRSSHLEWPTITTTRPFTEVKRNFFCSSH